MGSGGFGSARLVVDRKGNVLVVKNFHLPQDIDDYEEFGDCFEEEVRGLMAVQGVKGMQ